MSTIIYVLKLKHGKYYAGKSSDLDKSFIEHLSGEGSIWTKKHEPIEIEQVISNDVDIDKYVREYMYKYGIDNVRGGLYSEEILTDEQIKTYHKEIWFTNNKCFNCGGNHFVQSCSKSLEEKQTNYSKQK